ncbi:MAG: DUF1640 domain-containing protein [Gammaproteobacteria bacterium]|nr:DUF1640 domain-containing protein [Gammaproteobacteria bacterium]
MPQPAFDTHAEVGKLKQVGCPEKQAEAMVDLVSRAPLNAQVARTLEQTQQRLESIESTMATKADLEALRADMIERIETLRSDMIERIETLRGDMIERIETLRGDMIERTESLRVDLVDLRGSTQASIEALRAQMARMLWVQGLALATLIISLAGIMISLAGSG